MTTISVTPDEAWAIFRYVRQTDRLGREHDQEQAQRVHAALLHFKANPGSTYDLTLDTELVWWITRQVPDAAMTGTTPTGRNLLLKVMEALAAQEQAELPQTEAEEPVATEVRAPWRAAFLADDAALEEFARRFPEEPLTSA